MLRTYKYIIGLHCGENGEYSIIHLLSTYFYKFGQLKKVIIIFKNSILMHIIYVINQHHCDKIKDYPHVNH
jgi:hypothetical protein